MPPDDLAADLAAMGAWNYWFLRSCEAEAAYRAGQITNEEWARLDILCVQMTAAVDNELPPEIAEDFAAFELGIPVERARASLAWATRMAHKQRPIQIRQTWRPSRRSRSSRRQNVRTRRAKARAPSGDDSPSGHVGEPEEPSGCSTSPQRFDLLDAVALSLGWERAA